MILLMFWGYLRLILILSILRIWRFYTGFFSTEAGITYAIDQGFFKERDTNDYLRLETNRFWGNQFASLWVYGDRLGFDNPNRDH